MTSPSRSWRPNSSKTRTAAERLLERDVWPWFEKQWREKEIAPKDLLTIPGIALVRNAQLAWVSFAVALNLAIWRLNP
jgi:hypothetical protein